MTIITAIYGLGHRRPVDPPVTSPEHCRQDGRGEQGDPGQPQGMVQPGHELGCLVRAGPRDAGEPDDEQTGNDEEPGEQRKGREGIDGGVFSRRLSRNLAATCSS